MTERKHHICKNVPCRGSLLIFPFVYCHGLSSHPTACLRFDRHHYAFITFQNNVSILYQFYYVQSTCNSVWQGPDVEQPLPTHQLVILNPALIKPFICLICLLFNILLIQFFNSKFNSAKGSSDRKSHYCLCRSSKTHLERNWELNTDYELDRGTIYSVVCVSSKLILFDFAPCQAFHNPITHFISKVLHSECNIKCCWLNIPQLPCCAKSWQYVASVL